MEEYKLTLGLGITGSFCTFGKILRTTEALVQKGIKVIPVYSRHAGDYRRKGNSKYRAGRNHRSVRTF